MTNCTSPGANVSAWATGSPSPVGPPLSCSTSTTSGQGIGGRRWGTQGLQQGTGGNGYLNRLPVGVGLGWLHDRYWCGGVNRQGLL